MPRQLRIEYPGASYHVMCRGDQGEAILEDDKDRPGRGEISLGILPDIWGQSGLAIPSVRLPNGGDSLIARIGELPFENFASLFVDRADHVFNIKPAPRNEITVVEGIHTKIFSPVDLVLRIAR